MAEQQQGEAEEGGLEEVQMREHTRSTEEDDTLLNQPWYWPHISRGEVERRLARQPDGTFLVRDCTVPGDFALTVRKDGCNKCVRIYRQEKGFSLSLAQSTALFSTLSDLVDYYRFHSMATLNKRLGVHLQKAVSKPATACCNQYNVFKQLYDHSQEMQMAQNRLTVIQHQRSELDNKLKKVELTIPAMQLVQQMYFDNMVLQAEWEALLQKEATPPRDRSMSVRWLHREISTVLRDRHEAAPLPEDEAEEETENLDQLGMTADEQTRWADCTVLVLSRHKAISSRLEEAQSQCQMFSATLRHLDTDLQYVELCLVNMKNKHDELVRQMVELGCQKEFVCQVLEPPVETPEFDSSTWLVDCTRAEAVARLRVLPHGAFIVRHKDFDHFPYVLSVASGKDDSSPVTVHHCVVLRPKGRGLGFNAVLSIFPSIEELVLRHRYLSLRHYFTGLDVTLSFPAGCQEMLQRS